MQFFTELKRRNVLRVAAAYAVLAWLVIQVTDTVAPAMALPDWTLTLVIWIGLIGFPFALLFSWLFELTPQGLVRDEGAEPNKAHSHSVKSINTIISLLLALAVIFLVVDNYVLERIIPAGREASAPDTGQKSYQSIAVLPFANMSNDSEQDYLSDGLSEELLNLLAKMHSLKVAARTSSFAFRDTQQDIREIGQALNVSTVLEGSVRKSGDRVRITAQLIDADNGYHLWSDTYDRNLADIFAIQDEISAEIVSALRVHLGTGMSTPSALGHTQNLEAYDAYLRGRHYMRSRENVREALNLFRLATELDPNYAEAWAARAEVVILLVETEYWGEIPREEAYILAESNIDKALRLDPLQARAHNARGMLLLEQWRLEEALESLDKAIAINPNLAEAYNWRARTLARMGRIQESRDTLDKALEIDPLDRGLVRAAFVLALEFYDPEYFAELKARLPQYGDDIEWFALRQLTETRTDYAQVYQMIRWDELPPRLKAYWKVNALKEITPELGQASRHPGEALLGTYIDMGRYEEALRLYRELAPERRGAMVNLEDYSILQTALGQCEAMLETLRQAHGESVPIYGLVVPNFPRSNSNLALNRAYCQIQLGDPAAAEAIMAPIRRYVETLKANVDWGYHLLEAKLAVLENRPAAAVDILEAAISTGELKWHTRNDPVLQTIASDPRFQAVYAAVDAHIDAERAKLDLPPAQD